MDTKKEMRLRRKRRIRKKITGTPRKPRMSVFRSARHMYVQVIDDIQGTTIASASTRSPEVAGLSKDVSKTEAAKKVGEIIAKTLVEKNISKVTFDRNGYIYHGRIKALAETARSAGLKF